MRSMITPVTDPSTFEMQIKAITGDVELDFILEKPEGLVPHHCVRRRKTK